MSSVISVVLFLWVCCLGAGASQPGCFRDSTRGVTCTLVIQRLIKAPDGFARAVLAINGHVPGPSIEAIQGDNLRITVINLSDEHTMLHWHGIHQIGTPFMDGTDLVQCPIAPGGNMTYEFVADPPGTHWYHSHHGSQLIDGLFGPLIVQSRMDPYLNQYDEERVLIFGEWAQQTADRQTAAWKAFEYAFYANTTPARVSGDDIGGWWVNGFRYNWTYASDGSLVGVIPFTGGIINGVGHSVTSNSSLQTHYFVNVTSNVKYRFRLISFAPFYAFAVSFEGHAVDLIGSDGAILKRSGPYDTVYVHGGERYDVIVSATKTSGSYWIRLQTLENNKTQNRILGVLSYNGENILPSTNPESVPYGRRANCFTGEPTDQCIPFTEEKPFFATPLPPPDYTFTANLRFFYGPVINTLHYQPPPRPLLYDPNFVQSSDFSRCNPDEKCSRGCNCTSFETLRSSDLVQVVINNPWRQYNVSLSGAHPIHLHGHAFYVTGMGLNGSFNPDLHTLNRVDPPQKDTIIVPPGGWVVIEFFADNPGMWLMHCHMDHHLVDGMAMFFYENPLARWQMPSSLPSCNIHMQNQNGPVSSPNKGSKTSLASGFILLFAGLFF